MNQLNWRKRGEHPDWLNGRILVSVKGSFRVAAVHPTGDTFRLSSIPGYWTIKWDSVDYWLPLSELAATLPKEVSNG